MSEIPNLTIHFNNARFGVRADPQHLGIRTNNPIARSVEFENDYNSLENRPQINSVTLEGNLTAQDLGFTNVYYDTKANWNAKPRIIAEKAAIYIYSDAGTIYDENDEPISVAGIKVGDGTSYLIDMPYITDEMAAMLLRHITNTEIHLTEEEKEFWNNKVTCFLDREDLENLIFSKTNYVINGDIYPES